MPFGTSAPGAITEETSEAEVFMIHNKDPRDEAAIMVLIGPHRAWGSCSAPQLPHHRVKIVSGPLS